MNRKSTSLQFRPEAYQRLHDHLLADVEGPEQAAFLFAEWDSENSTGVIEEYRLLDESEFEIQSRYGLVLEDGVLDEVIKQAHDLETALIEAHSHPFHGEEAVGFSPSDWSEFDEVVRHVMWRLPERPYLALVFAPAGFDGLVWFDEDEPDQLASIRVGDDEILPCNVTTRKD